MSERAMEQDRRVPHLAPDCDPVELALSPAEGFLLSRIDGYTPWSVLREIGGLEPQEAEACLESWVSQGIVICAGSEPGTLSPSGPLEGQPPEPSETDPMAPEFEREVAPYLDISVEEQREILTFEAGLDRSYWEVLGVGVDAEPRTVKRAYFKLSRRFHPDRYYRREVGDFGPRLERIFKRLVEAHELLSDPATCTELRRSMGEIQHSDAASGALPQGSESGPSAAGEAQSPQPEAATSGATAQAEVISAPKPSKRTRQRQALQRLRRRFQIPEKVLVERRFKARQFYQSAMVAIHKKNVKEAASIIRLAIAFDPWNPEYKEGFAEVLAQEYQLRAQNLLERAALDGGSQAEALKSLEEALHYRPCDPEVNDKAARLALDLREFDRAREYAESACELAPGESSYRATLGMVLRSAGLVDKARDALDEALRLDPKNREARSELKKLRRTRRRH